MQALVPDRNCLFEVEARLRKIAGRESAHASCPMCEE
jgi:hypothetical protein